MNTQSNSYTFLYSSVIVLIVAVLLAITATALKPTQEKNIEIEKKQNILASLRFTATPQNADELYEKYITKTYTLNFEGNPIEGVDPFLINLREELKKPFSKRQFPVYESVKNDTTFFVIPVYGKGLWGPIWGYVSLQPADPAGSDTSGYIKYSEVYGVFFDHKGETPGLGAEINQPFFQAPFRGKRIFDESGKFIGMKVVKGGTNPDALNEVDAISGGTITSKGVQAMLDTCLNGYQNFLRN